MDVRLHIHRQLLGFHPNARDLWDLCVLCVCQPSPARLQTDAADKFAGKPSILKLTMNKATDQPVIVLMAVVFLSANYRRNDTQINDK